MKKIFIVILTMVLSSCTGNLPKDIAGTPPSSISTYLPPTLTTTQKKEKVGQYLINNNNCALPCYWGITPGITTWQEAKTVLNKFWKSFIEVKEGYYKISFEYPESENEGRYYYLHVFTNPANDTITTIRGSLDNSLKSFLINNQEPEKTYIRVIWSTHAADIDEASTFLIYLFYGKKGIWAKQILRNDGYDSPDNRKLKICTKSDIYFDNSSRQEGIEVILWNSMTNTLLEDDPIKIFDDISEQYVIKSIKEGTGIDSLEFYNNIINNPEEDYCFLINPDEWH